MKRALISTYKKEKVVDFARTLQELGIEVISTGGTAKKLQENGIEVTPVEEITGFPEILNGRVKTLNPFIHGGILARRENKQDMETLKNLKIEPIDLVYVNLYPFVEVANKPDVALN
ncbi:MAG: bifunctional phosphoribosylaminoimidazolecarboxamide formyltransferase/IMP cyclohydrolase, partial [Thermotogota bacterium]|nr:bifunctional phosphoribosylaminoimidazolecarboxamide formyltransferase/IMP cyclohydrolase [Thermotogota bacterium]